MEYFVSMRVNLTPHGQELVEAALARGVGRSSEEVVERALEATTGPTNAATAEERERRRQAVAAMLAFREVARAYLRVIAREPAVVRRALAGE